MGSYYARHLAAERLRSCYEIAPPRVQQYLGAEIRHVVSRVRPDDAVLELGCGYGRVLRELAPLARWVVGVDTARASLELGRSLLWGFANCQLVEMDAGALTFEPHSFDLVLCIQNGISAFKVEPLTLLRESLRVARRGGRVLMSTYSDKFWAHRLEWFRLQADMGLLGEIDWTATRDGQIVCRDGFRATTFSATQFRSLAAQLGVGCTITEVDKSSLFCEIAL